MSVIEQLRAKLSPDVRLEEPLARHTTFKIGGPAEFFFEARTSEDAVRAARVAAELGLPLTVLGGASNMLVADAGVRGLVLKMANRGFSAENDGTVIAEAGAPTGLVATRMAEAGLTGFEWAVGVPGTIGGAVRGNAGCYGGEMKDVVTSVRALRDGEEVTLPAIDCRFGYRDSAFKHDGGRALILSATLRLAPAPDPAAAKARLRQILLDRKQKQPVEFATAGCMFVNWTPSGPADLDALRKTLDLDPDEQVPVTALGTVPAAWIIDRAQLKGMAVGHLRVSEKHANFFVSDGKATADDVVALTAAVKTRVRNATDGVVQLHEEVEYVGFS